MKKAFILPVSIIVSACIVKFLMNLFSNSEIQPAPLPMVAAPVVTITTTSIPFWIKHKILTGIVAVIVLAFLAGLVWILSRVFKGRGRVNPLAGFGFLRGILPIPRGTLRRIAGIVFFIAMAIFIICLRSSSIASQFLQPNASLIAQILGLLAVCLCLYYLGKAGRFLSLVILILGIPFLIWAAYVQKEGKDPWIELTNISLPSWPNWSWPSKPIPIPYQCRQTPAPEACRWQDNNCEPTPADQSRGKLPSPYRERQCEKRVVVIDPRTGRVVYCSEPPPRRPRCIRYVW
jgi:hypothetical protein